MIERIEKYIWGIFFNHNVFPEIKVYTTPTHNGSRVICTMTIGNTIELEVRFFEDGRVENSQMYYFDKDFVHMGEYELFDKMDDVFCNQRHYIEQFITDIKQVEEVKK